MFRRKPNYETIKRLERDLGLTDEALQQSAWDAMKDSEWKERGGAVELDAKAIHWGRIYESMSSPIGSGHPVLASCVSIPTVVVLRG